MKQFEKMYKNSIFAKEPCHLITGDPIIGGVLLRILKEDIEYVWREALECVQDIACKGGILQNDFVIRKWIREELEDE